MKVSEITTGDICRQIRTDEFYLPDGEEAYLGALKAAAVEFVKSYTGLSDEELELHEDITIAVLVLITDMYDNRQLHVDKSNVNRVVDTILGMYCVNLL